MTALRAEVESFALPGWSGRIVTRHRPVGEALAAEVARLADPGSAAKTLHWGRNYLYVARFAGGEAGPLDVVVKQFRRDGARERLRATSKAVRSFRAALALGEAGIATPEPILCAESADPRGPCLYVCRHLADVLEARYLFRARNAGTLAEAFPDVDFAAFLTALGRLLRRLHDAGIWHRDVSGGNILVPVARAAAPSPEDLYLVDLNRARLGRRPTTSERSRDLSRLALSVPEDRARLLAAYWGEEGGATAGRRALYGTYRRAFLAKNAAKPRLRGARDRLRALLLPRRPHAHIPPAPAGAAARDKVVWDALSDQPHQHAGRMEKLGVRLRDAPAHARELAVVAAAAPRIARRYREIRRELARPERGSIPFDGLGLGLRPDRERPDRPEAIVAEVAELGVRRALLRLHPWESGPGAHRAEEALARALAAAGVELTFALPQNRDLVKDPARWRASVEELAARFLPYGRRFQIGHAINRSKWGIWNLGEYVRLATDACAALRAQGDVEILGPAVIDFEYHATAAVLNLRRPGLRFDAVSALLYVDRRGAPENRQAGFDTVGKVALLKAIAETSKNATGRCFVTEVNWPLWEGPHSPAGRAVSVDEETQADYLARYYLEALGTGLVEAVFWWQLAARGYGLLEPRPGEPARRRPAFQAFRTLAAELAGSRLEEILPAPLPARLYRFRRPDASQVVAAWSTQGTARATLPWPAAAVVGRDGEPLSVPAGREVELGPSVRYFRLVD